MKITILTLFPQIMEGFFKSSIMSRAVKNEIIEYKFVNFRDFAFDRHKTCDDSPYGGGAGMIIKPEPLGLALDSVDAKKKRVIYPSPSGKKFTQSYANELSKERELVFICGHYEGIDQRIIDTYVDDEICIGDYVISSGEVATLVVIDSIYRLIDGVITDESLVEESFTGPYKCLEYPQYTRPEIYEGMNVPDVLMSGHHLNIAKWRKMKRLEKTLVNRPELLEEIDDKELQKMIKQIKINAKGIDNE